MEDALRGSPVWRARWRAWWGVEEKAALLRALAEVPEGTREAVRLAWAARATAEECLSPRLDGPLSLALPPFRRAVELAVRAAVLPASPASLVEALDAAPDEVRSAVEVHRALLLRSPQDDLATPAPSSRQDVEALRGLFDRVIALPLAPRRRFFRLVARRTALLFAPAVLVAALVVGALALFGPRDLAKGRGFRASSVYPGFIADQHVCDGVRTDILFHTLDEPSPWVEIDLGATHGVRRVEIKNRTDSLSDRAVPLVVETSLDGQIFTVAARNDQPFWDWDATFAPTPARYVRVRSLKKTFLHLERIRVY